ncbi:MAG: YfhO family protein, partial [Eubacteriales bacterium]|nr:YfhO family protein [Eubacteriales bacterium]
MTGRKSRIQRHLYRCRFIYTAFLLSAAIFVIVCIARAVYPFGARSILKVDLFHQYAPYLEEFRSRVLEGKSLVYSWETGLGKDFLAQTAYYAASPLNFLVFLFPRQMISEVIALLILLKVSLSASSFTWYLREHFRRNDPSILLFGLMYAFCAFVTCYYWNIMWLDTVALFPLTAMGCERLIREGKVTLYYAALTLTMIVNFYLAVPVCILITLYAAVCALSVPNQIPDAGPGSYPSFTDTSFSGPAMRRSLPRAALCFAAVSELSAMSAMFILGPVAAALRETAVSGAAFPPPVLYPNWLQLLSAHFPGARDAVLARNEDMPNLCSGLLPVLLLPLYYNCGNIPRREKILYSSLLIFMLLCACLCPLDFMIHGFHFPANLPHRYTFVYSFILLCMAYRGFERTLLPRPARDLSAGSSAGPDPRYSSGSDDSSAETVPG